MQNRIRPTLALAAVVAAVALVLPAAGWSDIPQPKQCPKVTAGPWIFPGAKKLGSSTYGSYTVGSFTCPEAAKWIQLFSRTSVKNRKAGASNVLTNGPKGYLCTANPDANGHAFAGSCRKGKLASTVGFGWGGRPY